MKTALTFLAASVLSITSASAGENNPIDKFYVTCYHHVVEDLSKGEMWVTPDSEVLFDTCIGRHESQVKRLSLGQDPNFSVFTSIKAASWIRGLPAIIRITSSSEGNKTGKKTELSKDQGRPNAKTSVGLLECLAAHLQFQSSPASVDSLSQESTTPPSSGIRHVVRSECQTSGAITTIETQPDYSALPNASDH